MKRIVLFVEGYGDELAVPVLVERLLTKMKAWDCLYLDPHPFVVGGVNRLLKSDCRNWIHWLGAAAKRGELGAVLLVLDGDIAKVQGEVFCAAEVAKKLAQTATLARGGDPFSVATVFACQEFESWLIAGVESLSGRTLEDGRRGVEAGTQPPDGDLESKPRDAKGWLSKVMASGYNPVKDQAILTRLVDLESIRNRRMRSFRRLENAVSQIVSAIRNESPVTSPS